jgi:hypothetical protein
VAFVIRFAEKLVEAFKCVETNLSSVLHDLDGRVVDSSTLRPVVHDSHLNILVSHSYGTIYRVIVPWNLHLPWVELEPVSMVELPRLHLQSVPIGPKGLSTFEAVIELPLYHNIFRRQIGRWEVVQVNFEGYPIRTWSRLHYDDGLLILSAFRVFPVHLDRILVQVDTFLVLDLILSQLAVLQWSTFVILWLEHQSPS